MERRILAGASPCPKVVRTAGDGRARVLSRMPGRNRRGLTPLSRSASTAAAPAARTVLPDGPVVPTMALDRAVPLVAGDDGSEHER